jgi:hypothetical protein
MNERPCGSSPAAVPSPMVVFLPHLTMIDIEIPADFPSRSTRMRGGASRIKDAIAKIIGVVRCSAARANGVRRFTGDPLEKSDQSFAGPLDRRCFWEGHRIISAAFARALLTTTPAMAQENCRQHYDVRTGKVYGCEAPTAQSSYEAQALADCAYQYLVQTGKIILPSGMGVSQIRQIVIKWRGRRTKLRLRTISLDRLIIREYYLEYSHDFLL